jgi:hypothetical protein
MAARARLIASGGSGPRETAKPRRDARAAARSPSGSAARKIPPATSAPGIESRTGTTKPTPSAPPRLRANIPFSSSSCFPTSRLRVFARAPSSVPAKAGTQSQAEQRLMASGTLGSRLRGNTGLVSQGSRVRRSTCKSERRHTIAGVPQLDPGLCRGTTRVAGHPRTNSSTPAKAGAQLGRPRHFSATDASPRRDTTARTITPHHPSASSAPLRANPSPGASV